MRELDKSELIALYQIAMSTRENQSDRVLTTFRFVLGTNTAVFGFYAVSFKYFLENTNGFTINISYLFSITILIIIIIFNLYMKNLINHLESHNKAWAKTMNIIGTMISICPLFMQHKIRSSPDIIEFDNIYYETEEKLEDSINTHQITMFRFKSLSQITNFIILIWIIIQLFSTMDIYLDS